MFPQAFKMKLGTIFGNICTVCMLNSIFQFILFNTDFFNRTKWKKNSIACFLFILSKYEADLPYIEKKTTNEITSKKSGLI